MLVCVYRDGRGPGGVQATNSFDKSIMGKISKIGKAMKMSKAKSRDLMSFAALKKKLVIESGTDALNLEYVRPPPGCRPLVHGGSCVLSLCVCVLCVQPPAFRRTCSAGGEPGVHHRHARRQLCDGVRCQRPVHPRPGTPRRLCSPQPPRPVRCDGIGCQGPVNAG